MVMSGAKPNVDGKKRHRVPPTHEWITVVNVPYAGKVPPLPKQPRKDASGQVVPTPERELGAIGQALWERAWHASSGLSVNAETLLLVCEQMDERMVLRARVIVDGNGHLRPALRQLEQQIAVGLNSLGLSSARAIPLQWPPGTKKWWSVISRMPHCILWDEADWQYAMDTAVVASAFHGGDVRVANELRQREKNMGTTSDARRSLRIRYVDSIEDNSDPAIVTAMDSYRKVATGA